MKNRGGKEHLRGSPNNKFWGRKRWFCEECFLKLPQTGRSPGDFFVRQDKNIYQDGFQKKKKGRDKSISEGVTRTSLGKGRGGSVKKKI